jgi:UTP--glucose-1-phosphate uridylyltransferase
MKRSDTTGFLPAFIDKMQAEGLPSRVIDTFAYYYYKVITGETGLVYDKDIQPVQPDDMADFKQLAAYAPVGQEAFHQTVRIVLNGGLGTSMGLTGPKSLIKIKDGHSFLDIIIRQATTSGVKLAFMNSFNTHDETWATLSRRKTEPLPLMFLQHRFPKVLRKDYSPAVWPQNPLLEWNPPGHGDVYTALLTSGTLRDLLDEGIMYAFISNCDNLGARMDECLLGYFVKHQFPFMMEVAEKTPADIKGGHLARHKSGRMILREAAQCPADELDAFLDIRRYRFFNTNNIWVNLNALCTLFDEQRMINLPLILNPKTIDPRDKNSPPVYQIESAMGAAIALFDGAMAVQVPRTRFYPVKTCNDLLAVRSDCFVHSKDETVQLNPRRKARKNTAVVKIKLDPRYYGTLDGLEKRLTGAVPSLLECDSLVVEGDVRFEKNVTIKGSVCIKNRQPSQAVIKAESVIDQDLMF